METYKYLSKLWSPSTSSSASSSPEVAARTLPTPPPTPPPSTAAQLHEDDHAGDGEHRTDDRDASGASTSQSMATSGRVVDPDSGIEGDLLDVKTPPQPGDTLYLSARRRPRTLANQDGIGGAGTEGDLGPDDGRPQITISQGVPPHLEGAVRAELQRRASQGKGRATPPSDPGQDAGDGSETELQTDTDPVSVMRPANDAQQDELDGTNSSDNDKIVPRDESDAEPERLLAIKQRTHHQRQLRRRYQLSRSWPVRLSVSFYVLIRHLLSWVGIPYSPRSPHNALLAPPPYTELKSEAYARNNTLDNDQTSPDELLASLEKSQQQHQPPDQPSTPTRSSLFPWGTANPPSQTPSPALRPTPKPPRLTPKVLVLDLDETLIHSTSRPYASSKKNQGLKVRVVEVVLDGRSTVYTVYKRPWVDFFLRKVSTWYTVIIFTASLPEYADPVIDWLDGGDGGGGMVGGRLFRSDCVHAHGSYVKDLSVVDSDLSRVCLVDNSPVSYAINQANGIPIEGWINDPNDECLLDLLPMLDSLRFTSDVRRVLGLRGFGR